MPVLVGYILLFVAVGVGFILVHLLLGKLVRPAKPDVEKLTIYECGEPTVGSAWIQFDLRFYVVALLFVIFDVEVAFFFPWAVVFGKLNALADPKLPLEQRVQLTSELVPPYPENSSKLKTLEEFLEKKDDLLEAKEASAGDREQLKTIEEQLFLVENAKQVTDNRQAARSLAWLAFADILVFFGVLLVGFAYLWKRGDLDWVRSIAAERPADRSEDKTEVLVGSGR